MVNLIFVYIEIFYGHVRIYNKCEKEMSVAQIIP